MPENRINVTKSYLPPLQEFWQYIEGIWERNQLTNNGPLVQLLEQRLKDYLGVNHLYFIANGTLALQIAIKALDLHREIITTPFSYVATTSSIIWEGCRPVFVDIDPVTMCINPDLIEDAITSRTTAIMPTHVYGIPCDVKKIESIAQKHGLKVIYDAAHAFGVKHKGKALAAFGDISILSFHATKVFHTVEGGAIITDNYELAKKIKYMRNFGHKGQEDFWGIGINGKNSEFHAAMGLSVFPYIDEIIKARKHVYIMYEKYLDKNLISRPTLPDQTDYNFAYYPILFKSENQLTEALISLRRHNIYPRRYFYPSLDTLPYISFHSTPISQRISKRVLCLPNYHDLTLEDIEKISSLINNS